jgi:hypothetical protein
MSRDRISRPHSSSLHGGTIQLGVFLKGLGTNSRLLGLGANKARSQHWLGSKICLKTGLWAIISSALCEKLRPSLSCPKMFFQKLPLFQVCIKNDKGIVGYWRIFSESREDLKCSLCDQKLQRNNRGTDYSSTKSKLSFHLIFPEAGSDDVCS